MTTDASAPAVTRLALKAPLTGVLVPIEQVPDPVFAQKMVGEGDLDRPAEQPPPRPVRRRGHPHPPGRARRDDPRRRRTSRCSLHIGLDTVQMRGEGFTVKVKVGDQVRAGDELITFDLDTVATERQEPAHPDGDRQLGPALGASRRAPASSPRADDVVAEATLGRRRGRRVDGAAKPAGRTVTSDAVLVPNPVGLHARPAAVLSNLAAAVRERDLAQARRRPGQRQERHGDHGPGGRPRRQGPGRRLRPGRRGGRRGARRRSSRDGLGEEGVVPIAEAGAEAAAPAPAAAAAQPAPRRRSEDPNVLLGVAASPGPRRRHGPAGPPRGHRGQGGRHRPAPRAPHAQRRHRPGHGPARGAGEPAEQRGRRRQGRDLRRPPGDPARPGPARHRDERDRQGQDRGLRLAQGLPAVRRPARRAQERGPRRARHRRPRRRPAGPGGDHRAAPRAGRDPRGLDPRRRGPHAVGHRVPRPRPRWSASAPPAGGASSHVAILARSLDIPAVAGHRAAGPGHRRRHPGHPRRRQGHAADERHRGRGRADPAAPGQRTPSGGPSSSRTPTSRPITTDGHHVEVVANIGGLEDARDGDDQGRRGRRPAALGVRLPRPAQRADRGRAGRRSTPTSPRRCGPVSRSSSAPSTSAATSRCPTCRSRRRRTRSSAMRGIRVGLDRPEILRTQVRAILRAVGAGAKIHVMFPMIATIEDFRLAKAIFEEERGGASASRPVPVGIMVEVPSVAVMAAAVRRRGRLLLGRHERPHPVHPRHGPRTPQARAAGRRPQPGRPRADRAGRDRRARGRQVGRASAAASPPTRRPCRCWSASASTSSASASRPSPPSRRRSGPCPSPTARSWPPAPSPRTPPPRSAPSCRPTTTTTEPDTATVREGRPDDRLTDGTPRRPRPRPSPDR